MKNGVKRILIVDDHPIVRLGLSQLISIENDLEVCGEASEANEAITKITQHRPDLIIVDISLNGDMSGLDLIKAINDRYPDILILVVSMYEEPFYVDRAIRLGARGYIAKKHAYNTIIEAIRKILGGGIFLSETDLYSLLEKMYNGEKKGKNAPIDILSKRELEIFQMIGNGLNTTSIANILGLSNNTVQTYKRHIKEKMGYANHNELVRNAVIFNQKK